jgi:hypothetical protein
LLDGAQHQAARLAVDAGTVVLAAVGAGEQQDVERPSHRREVTVGVVGLHRELSRALARTLPSTHPRIWHPAPAAPRSVLHRGLVGVRDILRRDIEHEALHVPRLFACHHRL